MGPSEELQDDAACPRSGRLAATRAGEGRCLSPRSAVKWIIRYAEAALDSACGAIVSAPAGEQEGTLHREAFSMGTLAACGAIPEGFARRALLFAAQGMRAYDPRRPWHPEEIARKVDRSFTGGLAHPRSTAR